MARIKIGLEDKISLGKNSFSSVTISASVERDVDDDNIEGGLRETAKMVEDYMAEERGIVLDSLSATN